MNKTFKIFRINYNNTSIYISNLPKEDDKDYFLSFSKANNIKFVIRACFEESYADTFYSDNNINIYNITFKYGCVPSQEIVCKLLEIYYMCKDKEYILIQCLNGLGSAPLLCAILIIETGYDYYNTIDRIRRIIRGAFNKKQLIFLNKYYNENKKNTACCNFN